MNTDDALDGLLLALSRTPSDTMLVGIIADLLDEMDHPAAAWWRRFVPSPYYTRFPPRRWALEVRALVGEKGSLLTPPVERYYPGVTDLCQRLDRVAQSDRIDATINRVFRPASSRRKS